MPPTHIIDQLFDRFNCFQDILSSELSHCDGKTNICIVICTYFILMTYFALNFSIEKIFMLFYFFLMFI